MISNIFSWTTTESWRMEDSNSLGEYAYVDSAVIADTDAVEGSNEGIEDESEEIILDEAYDSNHAK